jgi:hypothetical protein
MIPTQVSLLKALVAAQVSVIEWGECETQDVQSVEIALECLDSNLKEATRLAKRLRKE